VPAGSFDGQFASRPKILIVVNHCERNRASWVNLLAICHTAEDINGSRTATVPAYPRFWKDWVEWGGTVIPQQFLSLLFFRRDCCKQTLLTLCHTRGLVWCPSILWDRVPADPRLGMAGGEFSTDCTVTVLWLASTYWYRRRPGHMRICMPAYSFLPLGSWPGSGEGRDYSGEL
jgi:hypothetical protein